MFEQLDAQARQVVEAGIAEAHRYGHGWLGTEHLLIGGLMYRSVLPIGAQALLPDADQLRCQLLEGRWPKPASTLSDETLLASLGIDIHEVRRRAAETFGTEAVQLAALRVRPRTGRRRRQLRKRMRMRRCERLPRCLTLIPGESLTLAPRVKEAFERASKRAGQRGEPSISVPVLLAALLGVRGALAAELLEARGVHLRRVRAALDPG
jgi:hypothetical protein